MEPNNKDELITKDDDLHRVEKYMFQFQRRDILNFYNKQKTSFWVPEEIDFTQDINDWQKLNEDEKYLIKHILIFFACSDGLVNENLIVNFYDEIAVSEIKSYYAMQIAIEAIHNETYGILLNTFLDVNDKIELSNNLRNMPFVKQKNKWITKWTNRKNPLSERIIAFIIIEGIFFAGSFCVLFWIKNKKILPGLSFSNELISKDELLHCNFGIHLYNNYIVNRLEPERLYSMFKEGLEVEISFIEESFKNELLGISKNDIIIYLKYVADKILNQLHMQKIYFVENPFPFMDNLYLEGRTNFFEKRLSDYQKVNTSEEFSLNEPF
jgi:ribonucleoside-diphosphate reductase beta chain